MKDDSETLKRIEQHARLIAWIVHFWFWCGVIAAGLAVVWWAKS